MTLQRPQRGRGFVLAVMMACGAIAVSGDAALAEPPSIPGNPGVPGLLAEIEALTAMLGDRAATIVELEGRVAELQARLDAASSRPVATGQTTCWDGFTMIDCAGTGQDGETRAGAALRYADNGDGTVTDSNTGLIWEKKTDDIRYSAADAALYVAALNAIAFGGYTDWRVPNVKELLSIAKYEVLSGPTISPEFCTLSCGGVYWTSSFTTNPPCRITVDFTTGVTDTFSIGAAVRAVRGGL